MNQLRACLLLFCVFSHACANAAPPCPATRIDYNWSQQCFEKKGVERRVKSRYLRQIGFDRSGHATIRIEAPSELVAVDRRGVVVIPGIDTSTDFDVPYEQDNVGRFHMGSPDGRSKAVLKCGFFNTRTYKVIIPAVYDNCHPYQAGIARVCTQCKNYCTDDECHNSVFIGGNGVEFNQQGKVLRRLRERTMHNVCGTGTLAQVRHGYVTCVQRGKMP